MSDHQIVIGVGASAGGLEALEQLTANLPAVPEKQASMIIALHTGPNHKSLLSHILAKKSPLPVVEAEHGQVILPGMVYVAPAGYHIQVNEGEIILTKPLPTHVPQPSIDLLFTSLADAYGKNTVAIVLSGTGSDGVQGIRAVKAKGGTVIVQKPETARHQGMPAAALQTGLADLVLSPEEIGAYVRRTILSSNSSQPARELTPTDELQTLLHQKFNVDLTLLQPKYLTCTVAQRISAKQVPNLEAYVELLKTDPEELNKLFHSLSDCTTAFFRDPEVYARLEEILLPKMRNLSWQSHFRVWVAGCSTGEEAYSLAMLLQNRLEQICSPPPVLQIFATDINEQALQVARKGIYSAQQVSSIPQHLREKYLLPLGEGYEVSKKLRSKILFCKHDLTSDPPFLKIDLLSCRNLLHYFNPTIQQKIFTVCYRSLQEEGVLLSDMAESIENLTDIFVPLDKSAKIFCKKTDISPQVALKYKNIGRDWKSPKSARLRQEDYQSRLLDTFGTLTGHTVLVADAGQQILEARGDINGLLQISEGELNFSIDSLIISDLRTELKTLLIRLVKEEQTVRLPLKKIVLGGQPYYVRIQGSPLAGGDELDTLFMIVIEKFTPEEFLLLYSDPDNPNAATAAQLLLLELEQELASTKQSLQTYVQELEKANIQLNSFNEELQTGNEELTSANEELATAYNEIRKVHEELVIKEEDEKRANLLFRTLFENMQQGNLLLGETWDILLMNARAQELLQKAGVAPCDKECNLSALLPADLHRQLLPLLIKARESGQAVVKLLPVKVGEETCYYEFYINPVPFSPAMREQTITLSITDRTEEKMREAEIFRRDRLLSSLIDSDTTFVVRLDLQGRYSYVNPAFCKKFGVQPEEIIGKNYRLMVHPDDIPTCEQQISQLLTMPEGTVAKFEMRKPAPAGGYFFTDWEFVLIRNAAGEIVEVQGVGRDITEKKNAEETARLIEERNQAVLQTMAEGIIIQDLSGAIISCNPRAEVILGLTYEQMIGRTSVDPRWQAIREDGSPFPGEEHPAMVTLRTGEPQSNVLMGVHKPSGAVSWISVNSQLLRHPDTQEPYAVFTTFHDITQRKNAEQALAAAHKRFESIVDSTDGIVWELDYSTFCFTYVSRKAERLLGYSQEEWMQPGFWQDHLHPEDREKMVAYCIECSERLEPHEFEYRFIAKDGRAVWLHDIVTVVASGGKPSLLRGIMIDITRHKEMEQTLERLSWVAKRTSNAVVITDVNRRMIWVNDAFTRITGYTLDEVQGKTPRMFQFEGTNQQTVAFVNEQLSKQQPVRFEILNRGKHGNTYWLEVEVQPLFDAANKLTGFMAIQTDITERKKAEEQIKKQNEILKEIAFTQSHILRRPLANVLGLLNLIEMERNGSKIAALYEYFDYLLQSAREADEIIHRIVEKTNEMEDF